MEEISETIRDQSVSDFNTLGEINSCVLSLITFETIAQCDNQTSRTRIKADVVKDLGKFVNVCVKNHKQVVHENHGIKLKDQQAILLPVGLDTQEIDLATSNALDAYGTKRGGVAHKLKIKTSETKSSILSESNGIFVGLKTFDEAACKIANTKTYLKP